ncbi:MAG: ABC transporter permease [Treponema sp.]|nr:ABC transporter permease [Treponema sp.]
MINVANKGIIRKLTVRFLKAGRTRNIIAVIAIALTSVMFTSVFTIGGNMISAIQEQTMRQVGTSAHGGLKYLTMEQYENFARSPLAKDIAYRKGLALAENDALAKKYSEISFAEDKLARWFFSYPSTGSMPLAKNEAATSTIVLEALGVPHEIGAKVPLEFTVGSRKYSEVFTLSGFWEGDPVLMAQQIWLSREYVDAVVSENAIPVDELFAGKVFADVWFGSSIDIESKILRLINERGYADGEIQYGVNWGYAAADIDYTTVAIAILVIALILLSGYLIIYSVFAISVKTDIHFYGLLKTIGTTGTQLRKIVRGQALALSLIGIPVGLLLGWFSGMWLTPVLAAITALSGVVSTYTANPLIFIFAAAFSLLTVYAGCRKPGKIASRVSPVEAVKYSGVPVSGGKAKRTCRVTPLSMAWANVTREKRKLIMIVLSLSLALILLNSAVSATRSFDMDAYLSGSIISDFAVADYSVFGTGPVKNTSGVTADFLREAEAQGAGSISSVFYYGYNRSDAAPQQVYGVGERELKYFSDIDYERLRSGKYAVVSRYVLAFDDNAAVVPEIGDTLTITDDNGVVHDIEVVGLIDDYPVQLSARFRYANGLQIILADDVFLDLFGAIQPMQTNINVSAENISGFESWLKSYTSNQNPALDYISRNTLKAEFEGLQTTYLTMGGAMSFILALIGVLNFINAIVASIIARRKELAMLQSVGMTGKQMRSTLFYEGVCYTALTAFFTLTAGFALGRLILQVIAGQVWFFRQSFTVAPSLYCVLPLFLICAIVPLACYKWLVRESLVERLRVE